MVHFDDSETQKANRRYIRTAMGTPLLTRDEEFELARRWRQDGDEPALHDLVGAYARLVISTASRFRNYGLPMGDLIQEGNIGLMQAAARFEPAREVRFSTYATWWIRSAIQDFVLRNWSIVRTGTTSAQKSLFFNLRRLRAQIADTSGSRISPEGRHLIADQLNVSEGAVESMEMRLSGSDQSLNVPIGDGGGGDWQNFLADQGPNPEDIAMRSHDTTSRSRWLSEALQELTAREQTIIRARRLVDAGATLEELGRELGVSKERVRQLESRAMGKLKQLMRQRVERDSDLFVDA